MWTEITRRKYEREGQRYASDLTDGEWALIEPHLPAAKRLGRPRETEKRNKISLPGMGQERNFGKAYSNWLTQKLNYMLVGHRQRTFGLQPVRASEE